MKSEFTYHGAVVVFDLDDTLYYEKSYVESGVRHICERFADSEKSSFLTEQVMMRYAKGENLIDALLAMLRCEGVTTDEPTLLSCYRAHLPDISLHPGAADTLMWLRDKGVRLALITDGRSLSQRNKIEALGLVDFFSPQAMFISEETGEDKTSASSFRSIMRAWPEAKAFCYVADNTARDFLWPSRLGWKAVCMLDEDGKFVHSQNLEEAARLFREGDFYTASSFDALKKLLERII